MNIKINTRADFPITPQETFHVRDGSGRVVETWQHLGSNQKGTAHDFDVQGYSDAAKM